MKTDLIIVIFFAIGISSCSKKYYNSYFVKRLREVTLKYDSGAVIKTNYVKTPDREKITKKKINQVIKQIERHNALVPDSVRLLSKMTFSDSQLMNTGIPIMDTFYFRQAKIDYIKKHNLITSGKHFILRYN